MHLHAQRPHVGASGRSRAHSCGASGTSGRPSPRRTRAGAVVVRVAAADDLKDKPEWTGDALLSRFVNALIASPLYGLMAIAAKAAMKGSVDGRGISWDGTVAAMRADGDALEDLRAKFAAQPPGDAYPPYYLVPFHAYAEGNLNWLASFEVEPASYAMAIRTFKDQPELSAAAALAKLRAGITGALADYHTRHDLPAPRRILDVGCSTGISTRSLSDAYPNASRLVGLDLSPFFLAVAERYEQTHAAADAPRPRPEYMRGLAEATPFENASFDLIAFQFIIHECPAAAIDAFVAEARRVAAPGGVVCFVDNNPRSATIQNLPPALFTLMKSTEPWSDEYYAYDLEAALARAGFGDVVTVEADHRHRAVFGLAPPE